MLPLTVRMFDVTTLTKRLALAPIVKVWVGATLNIPITFVSVTERTFEAPVLLYMLNCPPDE